MKRWLELVLAEPYRVFFPLGILAGSWGVMMWPLLYGGHLGFYPGEAHARIMTGGFMGAFVAGFLGTAFPRLTDAPRWLLGEFLAILTCWGLMIGAWSHNRITAGDEAYAVFLISLLAGLAIRACRGRRDTPPPGFILVVIGIGGAAASAAWLARGSFGSVEAWRFARLWMFQGSLLLPVMGVGPYLLPRFFGQASRHAFESSAMIPEGWWRPAAVSTASGICVVATFAMEAWGGTLAGQLARAVVVMAWFAMETPVLRKAVQRNTPGTAVRWSLASMAAGLACAAVWPHARAGSLHLFFVSGLGLLTMAVGSRVILGHAGRHDLLGGRLVWLRWLIGLSVLAAATRMTSDFIPAVRISHHIYAAWCWLAGSMLWISALARFLFRTESKAKEASACPRRKLATPTAAPFPRLPGLPRR